MAPGPDDRSLGELFAELSRETSALVRKEVELATTEMTAKAKVAGTHAASVAAGGALVHAGLLVFLSMLVIALTEIGVTPWLAALLVALVTMGIGYAIANKGLTNLRRTNVAPTQTMESLKETTKWTKRTPA
jgi:drug/metabolite transporter (DMT)-like permease